MSSEVSLITSPSPLREYRYETTMPEGLSIGEMLSLQGFPLDGPFHPIITINGEEIPEAMLNYTRPKAGTEIRATMVPQGGRTGKAILGIIIGILIVVASLGTLSALGFTYAAMTSAPGLVAIAGLAGGLAAIGSAIYSIVSPPPSISFGGDSARSQNSYQIQGTRNIARPYEPVPTVLGQIRMFPNHLARPYTEVSGPNTYLRILLTFGYGPLDITDIRIGENPLSAYDLNEDLEYRIHPGFDDDAASGAEGLTIFTSNVTENGIDNVLLDSTSQTGTHVVNGITSNLPGESFEITTDEATHEVSMDFGWPGGMLAINKESGNSHSVKQYFHIQYRLASDSGAWETDGTDDATEVDEGITVSSRSLIDGWREYNGNVGWAGGKANWTATLKQRGFTLQGISFKFPSVDQWTMRVTLVDSRVLYDGGSVPTNDPGGDYDSNTITNQVKWVKLRSIKPYIHGGLKNLALLEMKIRASDRLNGVVDTVNALCTSILPIWSISGGWSARTLHSSEYSEGGGGNLRQTRNPAWIFAHVLRGKQNPRPAFDDQIDTLGLLQWANDCADGTIGGFKDVDGSPVAQPRNLDAVVDYNSTTRKLLDDIAGAARSSFNIIDGRYGVVTDKERTSVVQHFTPRNSHGFSGTKTYRNKTHAFRINFQNPDNDYKPDEMIVYNDGYAKTHTTTLLTEFDRGYLEDWVVADASTTFGDTTFRITSTASAGDNVALQRSSLDFAASTFNRVVVRVRRTGATAADFWKGALVWKKDAEVSVDLNRVKYHGVAYDADNQDSFADGDFVAEPDWSDPGSGGEDSWVTLYWDCSDHPGWSGRIKEVGLYFIEGTSGYILEFDWIRIDDGVDEATEFAGLDLWGVTDSDQVYRDARYHMISSVLRPETYRLNTDVEHLACTRGDKVRVTHDTMAVGLGGARLTSVTTNVSSEFVSGELDEEFHFDSGKEYAIHIRMVDAEEIYVPLKNENLGYTNRVVADAPVAYGGAAPSIGDLVLFGEAGKNSGEYIVTGVTSRHDLGATLSLVDYNDAVYEPGQIPEFVSNTSTATRPESQIPSTPLIEGIVSDETVMNFSGAAPVPRVAVTCRIFPGGLVPTQSIEVQHREIDPVDGTEGHWLLDPPILIAGAVATVFIVGVDSGSTYDIRARALGDDGTASDWSSSTRETVIGGSTPPPDPTDIRLRGREEISWTYTQNLPVDFHGFIVKYQSGSDNNWSTGIPAHDGIVTDNRLGDLCSTLPSGATTLMVRAIDLFKNESSGVASGLFTIPTIVPENQIVSQDSSGPTDTWNQDGYVAAVMDTVRTNCTVNGSTGYLEADDEGTLFWATSGGGGGLFWASDGSTVFWNANYKQMVFEDFTMTVNGAAGTTTSVPIDMITEISVEGSSWKFEYAPHSSIPTPPALVTWKEYRPWTGSVSLSNTESLNAWTYYKFRITIDGGPIQGKLKGFTTILSSHTVDEVVPDLSVLATDDQRATPRDTYRAFTAVLPQIQGDTTNRFVTVHDKTDLTNGPIIRVYDENGDRQAATVDVVLRGY